MTPDEAPMFVAALSAVAEIFERDFSDAAQMLYFDALKDLALADCLRALETASRLNTFMPRPAELRQFARGSLDPELAVEAAWLRYRQLARQVGGYQSVTITDPALADTLLEMFGTWEQACWSEFTPEMWAAKRKEFGRVYRVMQERGQTAPKVLTGYCERDNITRGYLEPQTALVPLAASDGLAVTRKPEHPGDELALRLLASREAKEAEREIWRANFTKALERHHGGES